MKLKLDENLPAELLGELRAAGHDIDGVVDEGLQGASDPMLLKRAREEGRVLLTLDKGIGNVRTYPPEEYAGIVLFRPDSAGREAVFEFVKRRAQAVLDLDLAGQLVVVTQRGARRR